MDQLIGLFMSIVMSYTKAPDCEPRYHYTYEYEYVMPEGLHANSDWNEVGYFYFGDDFGNSGEIGYSNYEIGLRANSNRKYFEKEIQLDNGAIKFSQDLGFGSLGMWEVEILVPLDKHTAIIMIAKEGDSSAYVAFEEKALQLARSVVQGDSHARNADNCDRDGHPFWSLLPRWGAKG